MALFFGLSAGTGERGFASWRSETILFWCRVLYSLSTLPFLAFNVPAVRKVLTKVVKDPFDPALLASSAGSSSAFASAHSARVLC